MENTAICNNNTNKIQVEISASEKSNYYRSAKDVIVSGNSSVYKPKNMWTDRLYTVLYNIKTGTWKKDVESVREIADKDKRNKFKQDTLGFFNIGEFRNNYRNNNSIISTEFMIFDFDHFGKNLEDKKSELKNNPGLFALFVSPSGDGLKAVFRLDKPVNDKDQFSSLYKHYASKLNADLGEKPDKTSDVSRACFFSYDPDVYLNESAVPLEVDIKSSLLQKNADVSLKKSKKVTKGKKDKKEVNNKDGFKNVNFKDVSIKRNELLLIADSGVIKGERNTALVKFTGLLLNKGIELDFLMPIVKGWNLGKNNPPLPEDEVERTVNYLYGNHSRAESNLPMIFKEKNNQYVKTQEEKETVLSTFIIRPKEHLILKDSDCLTADVVTMDGRRYEDIHFENSDWHTRARFLKALGHTECTFLGSDRDVQGLCGHVVSQVTIRKTGTKVIGLHGDTWVVKNSNITKDGISSELTIVPFEKGGDAFYNRIEYRSLSKEDYSTLVKNFCRLVTRINDHEVILPWLGWILATPLKPRIMEIAGSFPLMYVHGIYGYGKSSTAGMFQRLLGYTNSKPDSCTLNYFPMVRLLSSTNAIPICFDEFKKGIGKESIENLLRFMRRSYGGEIETKGQQDQSLVSYEISAPMAVMGELDITEGAVKERVIMSRFSNAAKINKSMQDAFEELKKLQLEGFMSEYIRFCLNLDINNIHKEASGIVENHFLKLHVDTRIKKNLTIMILGLILFKKFGEEFNAYIDEIDYAKLLNYELKEITGTESGEVRSPLDYMVEELSIMAMREIISKNKQDFKMSTIKDKNGEHRLVIAIRFSKVYNIFKEHCQRTSYEHDLQELKSYYKMMEVCPYIAAQNHTVKFDKTSAKCLCIDYRKAEEAGINLDGFKEQTENILLPLSANPDILFDPVTCELPSGY